MYQTFLREPTLQEIAEAMGIAIEKAKDLQTIVKEPISMEQSLNSEDDGTIGDLIADEENSTPLDEIFQEEISKKIQSILDTLDSREADILIRRYGLNNNRAQTLEEIGKEYKLTKERIRQIEEKALRKLRNPIRAKALRECLEG